MDALSSLLASACAFALVFVFSASAAALTLTFSLEYQSGSKKYQETLTVDLRAGVNIPVPKTATSGKELQTISYTLQEALQKNL